MAEPTRDDALHPALLAVLREDRESLNQRFQLRQRAGAKIDGPVFQRHLQTTVNDLVGQVAIVHGERVRAVVHALFDVSLDLFNASLLGPEAKHPYVAAAWRDVLPQAVTLLARDPVRVAGCVSNAADHLAAIASARPLEWIGLMARLARHCDSVPQWLEAGKVAAWKAGLVQYRSAALRIARELPWKLSALLFDMPGDVTESDWLQRLDRLEIDRWYLPQSGPAGAVERSLCMVRTTGGFRGFGGPCVRPPKVKVQSDRLFVSDGDAAWQLFVDAFGTGWHRVPELTANAATSGVMSEVALDKAGQASWHGKQGRFAELADASSYACDGQTLAVTLPTSHHVFLVAQVSDGQD